jgi:hypothetical protein
MKMPAFHDSRIYARKVNLPELLEYGRISPQHVHDFPTLVMDLTEGSHHDSFNHETSGK